MGTVGGPATGVPYHISVIGNIVDNSSKAGIAVDSGQYVDIIGNRITDVSAPGLMPPQLNDGDGISVTNTSFNLKNKTTTPFRTW